MAEASGVFARRNAPVGGHARPADPATARHGPGARARPQGQAWGDLGDIKRELLDLWTEERNTLAKQVHQVRGALSQGRQVGRIHHQAHLAGRIYRPDILDKAGNVSR